MHRQLGEWESLVGGLSIGAGDGVDATEPAGFHPSARAGLREAKRLPEHSSFIARLTGLLGRPIETGIDSLPPAARERILRIVGSSLERALRVAIWRMSDGAQPAWKRSHKAAVAATGGIGGAFGAAALAVELPISTTIMLRSIADIARSEGETLDSREAQLACLSVFALGGPSPRDDAMDTGYFAIRAALARSVSKAAAHVASHGLCMKSPPTMLRLIGQVAARFSIPVTQK